MCMYVLNDAGIYTAVCDAMRKDTLSRVHILLDRIKALHSNFSQVFALLDANVELYVRSGYVTGSRHLKVVVIDGVMKKGSMNISDKGLRHSREVLTLDENKEAADKFVARLDVWVKSPGVSAVVVESDTM